MSNLAAHFNWNRNSTIITDDYASNGNISEGMTDITIGTGVVGKTAIFNGSTSTIKFGNVLDAGGLDTISWLFQIKKASSKDQILVFKDKNVIILLNANDTVSFGIFIGVAFVILTSTGIVGISTTTIQCIYDGVGAGIMAIYIDGELDSSQAQVGTIESSTDDFALGHNNVGGDSLFFDGEMEAVDFRIDALDSDKVSAWHDNPLGTEFIFQNPHNLSLGDIVGGGKLFNPDLPEIIGSVSFLKDDSTIRIKPILNQFNLNQVPVRRANIFDQARQWLAEYQIVVDEPVMQIRDRIDILTKSAPDFEALKGFKFTKDALIFKAAMIADFVIEPPITVGTINDFAPIDLEFATTMYISSTNPANWHGLLAPVPLRPQWMFIINSGTKNITAKPEAGTSQPNNRFDINGNISFGPNELGFVLYDVTRLRWRVNKI